MSALQPFVSEFKGKTKISSEEFVKIFSEFDKDGNGFIEAGELDSFLKEICGDNEKDLKEFKENLLKKYDENFDGKISMKELVKVLPTDENFLLQFRESHKLHIADFLKLWYHYDTDRSGFLERSELNGFLHDLLSKQNENVSPQRINDYAEAMIELFDSNNDGKIELNELAKIISVEENFLKNFEEVSMDEFEKIFAHYDQDGNGYVEGTELLGFIRDLMASKSDVIKSTSTKDLESYQKIIMECIDEDNDGKVSKDELKLLFK
ncbi:calbindin-32 isoform X1 [Hydra vulgaris]|uniref:Calbindin n=1 Tax=Hydra vulgaris TaxID=6087 RepID=T2MHT3_HYDVU|nr:calbindin-32 isoform X1 [Hydra vulgaris]